jgi:hypothetical protein
MRPLGLGFFSDYCVKFEFLEMGIACATLHNSNLVEGRIKKESIVSGEKCFLKGDCFALLAMTLSYRF